MYHVAYFLDQLINGVTLGAIYGLVAIGYTMVYGILRLINFAHGDDLEAAAAFHEIWLREFRAAHLKQSVWGGDQDTLRELFAAVDFAREDSFNWRLGDIDIRFLPCARYNFSTAKAHEMDGYYPDALVLHFKGKRKPYMFPYWRTHIRDKSVRN